MGMSIELAELITIEHKYKPLPPVVYTVGRLFTGFTQADVWTMLARHAIMPCEVEPEFDTFTIEGRRAGSVHITERTFFKMLGVKEVSAIDINSYEGASIVCDLCEPIPDSLASVADFIVGGSTLDNIFDPAQYLRNMARLLRPGGRIFEINASNNHKRPYVMMPVPWFFDFFAVNEFADCRVCAVEISNRVHVFLLEPYYNPVQQVHWGLLDNFDGDDTYDIITIAFAEKAETSTWHRNPVQDTWRDERRVREYGESLKSILGNVRPPWQLRFSGDKPRSLNRCAHSPYRYVGHF